MSHGLAEYALPRCPDTARGIPGVSAGKRAVILVVDGDPPTDIFCASRRDTGRQGP